MMYSVSEQQLETWVVEKKQDVHWIRVTTRGSVLENKTMMYSESE